MKKIWILLLAGLAIQSCKKERELTGMSSITIVNAAIDAAGAKAYASDRSLYWSSIPTNDVINFAASKPFGVISGPKLLKAAVAADSTKVLYNGQGDFKIGGINTLFLCGQPGNYEGILLSGQELRYYKEEVLGIRFINLSPNSPAVKVVLAATPTVNEISGLVYKQVTDFKTYPVGDLKTGIAFQIRDAATDALLASYTLPATAVSPYTTVSVAAARYKNVTLVIKGLAGTTSGANAFGVFPVAHY